MGGSGFSKIQKFKEMCEALLEFPEGNYALWKHFWKMNFSITKDVQRLQKKINLPQSSHIEGLSNSHQNHFHPEVRTNNQHLTYNHNYTTIRYIIILTI